MQSLTPNNNNNNNTNNANSNSNNNSNNKQPSTQPIDEWFKLLGDNQIGECLRLYALACNNRLAPYLTQVIQDRSLFDVGEASNAPGKQNQTSSNVSDTMPATPDGTPSKPESVGAYEVSNMISCHSSDYVSRTAVFFLLFRSVVFSQNAFYPFFISFLLFW